MSNLFFYYFPGPQPWLTPDILKSATMDHLSFLNQNGTFMSPSFYLKPSPLLRKACIQRSLYPKEQNASSFRISSLSPLYCSPPPSHSILSGLHHSTGASCQLRDACVCSTLHDIGWYLSPYLFSASCLVVKPKVFS